MDPPLTVAMAAVCGAIALFVAVAIFTSAIGPELGLNRTSEIDYVLDRLHALVLIEGQPSIHYEYENDPNSNLYHYTILFSSVNLKANKNMDIFAVAKFKEKVAKIETDENSFAVEANQLNGFSGTAQITSAIPPIKIVDQEEIDDVPKIGQKYLMKNYLVEVIEIYESKINVPLSPDIEITECKTVVEVGCKSARQQFSLELPEEDVACDIQDDITKCRKSYNLCDGEITIELVKFFDPRQSCKNKKPLLRLHVPEEAEEWKTGEKLIITLWKVPENPTYSECWKKNLVTIDRGCFDHLVGAAEITIPKEDLPV